MSDNSLRAAIKRETVRNVNGGSGIWDRLKEKLDFAFYRPEAAQDVVASALTSRQGTYYIIKNPTTMTYYRLSDRDHFLWQRMDGSSTVKDLVVAYFMEYGTFAFAQVAGLVNGLKSNLFLVDRPVNIYQQVEKQLQPRSLDYSLRRLSHFFLEHQFAINGIDGILDTIYRKGGWLLFTRPVQAIFWIIILLGLAIFLQLFASGSYSLVSNNNSLTVSVLVLLGANFIAIMLHELGHALTVKHFGREVRRGGFMIYFGMPAWFIDTTDIWLENKKARLAVTWAGPQASLIVGGLVTLPLAIWADFAFNSFLYKVAVFNYLGVLINLNPLLELDGYFLLMDWLEIPRLRQKSLAYLRSGLWQKLKANRADSADKLSFTKEEKIFVVFGLLAAVWSVIAVILAIIFYQGRVVNFVRGLWIGANDAGRVALAIAGVALGLVTGFIVLKMLQSLAKRFISWAEGRGLLDKSWVVASSLWALAVLLVAMSAVINLPALWPIVNLIALGLAVTFAWRNAQAFSGSWLAPIFFWLGLASLLFLVAQVANFSIIANSMTFEILQLVAVIPLLIAGGFLFASSWFLSHTRPVSAIIVGGPLVIIGLLGWLAITRQPQNLALLTGWGYLIALALCLPTAYFRLRTPFAPTWVSLCLALLVLAASNWITLSALLPFLLLAAALGMHHLAFIRLRFRSELETSGSDRSDQARLQRAFVSTMSNVLISVRQTAGQRSAQVLTKSTNKLALTAGWPISIDGSNIKDQLPEKIDLFDQGSYYASSMSLLLDLAAREVGEQLLGRMFQSAYDHLTWEVREIAANYFFPGVDRAGVADDKFQAEHLEHKALLRRMPLFATLDEVELELLLTQLKSKSYAPNQIIMRQGEPGELFFIIKRGHIEVEQQDENGVVEIIAQLDRGDYLGELALLNNAPRSATCRATVPTELLSLSRKDFETLVQDRFDLHDKLDETITRTTLLRRIPIFTELDSQQLQLIVSQLREETFDAGQVIIKQGDIGDAFFIIESGHVEVTVNKDGQEFVIDENGPGSYVGEIALLLDTPRTASVTATVPTQTLTMYKDDFDRLVSDHLYVSRGLEQVMSRRMIRTRRTLPEAF
jgi:putative peptide zinc metalloprotease protein